MKISKGHAIFLVITAMALMVLSCKKDLGNYNYKDINELSFANLDTINGYSVDLGDILNITPAITATTDGNLTGNYIYAWKLLRSGMNLEEKILSTEKNLHLLITLQPGTYSFSYNVRDSNTGVTWMTRMPLNVTTPFYEGWLVLNKINNTSRLDFLSWKNNDFIFHKDVLTALNSGLPPQGEPRQIFFMRHRSNRNFRAVFLSTESGATLLDPENFSYSADRNIEKFMVGDVPQNFTVDKFFLRRGDFFFGDDLFMYANNNLYTQLGLFYYGTPLNTSKITGNRFNISPNFVINGGGILRAVMYNQDDKVFVTADTETFPSATDLPSQLNFPNGKELLYMTDNDLAPDLGTNYAYAVLKDPGVDKFYVFRFSFADDEIQPVDYYEEINAPDFAMAEHYAVSPELGYLFYSVGGKLYEYDLFLKTSKLMLDLGNEKISLLVFDNNKKPATWTNWLSVGYYDPSGPEGENGTFAQYSVPPVNGPLQEEYKWTGFGEVVSVSYRYR